MDILEKSALPSSDDFGNDCRRNPWGCRLIVVAVGIFFFVGSLSIIDFAPNEWYAFEKSASPCIRIVPILPFCAYIATLCIWSMRLINDASVSDDLVFSSGMCVFLLQLAFHSLFAILISGKGKTWFLLFLIGDAAVLICWVAVGQALRLSGRARDPVLIDAVSSAPKKARVQTGTSCLICDKNEVGVRFAPCGHASLCLECSMTVEGGHCPTCDIHIERMDRVYYAGFVASK